MEELAVLVSAWIGERLTPAKLTAIVTGLIGVTLLGQSLTPGQFTGAITILGTLIWSALRPPRNTNTSTQALPQVTLGTKNVR